MRDRKNIEGLIDLKPDFIGFIFYSKSARYAKDLDEELLNGVPSQIKKVGVFVNAEIEQAVTIVKKYRLDYAQLHGDETVSYAEELNANGIQIIKVFRVTDSIPEDVCAYSDVADYFLFDTQTKDYGGSGKQFDWSILNEQDIRVPFLLSGGINLDDLDRIQSIDLPMLAGIDVNSRFELEPGLKDLNLVRQLKYKL